MSEESQVDEVTEETDESEVEELDASDEGMSDTDKDAYIAKLRKEAASRRVKNKAQEAELAEYRKFKESQMSDLQKAEAKAAELEAELQAVNREKLQRKVAKAVKLPVDWADRISGDSEDEMKEDARALLARLKGQPSGSIARGGNTGTVVGGNNSTDEGAGDWLRNALLGKPQNQ